MRDILKEFTEKRKNMKAKNKPVRIATTLGALAVAALVMWGLMVPGIAMGDDDNQADEVTIELADESETGEVIEETDPEDTSEYTGGGMDAGSDSSDAANTSDASNNSNTSDNQDKTAGGDTSVDNTNSSDNENQKTTDASANTNGNAQETEDNSADSNGSSQENNNQNSIDSSNSDSSDTIDQNSGNNSENNLFVDTGEIKEADTITAESSLLSDEITEEDNIAVVDDTDDIHEGVTVTVSSKKIDGIEGDGSIGGNGQTLKVNVTSNSSSADQEEEKKIKLVISALPEGVTLAGFNASGEMVVEYETSSGKMSITLRIEEGKNGEKYVTYEQPAGSTINFELTFNSTNGTMEKESTVTVTPNIEDKKEGQDTCSDPVTLNWTGENKWDKLQKTVDKTEINVTKDDAKKDQLGEILTYTISAEQHNGDQNTDTGAIWTKEVQLTDTLTLPEGMKFTDGTKISDDKTEIVDADGSTIFSFTGLPNYAEVTNLTINGNTVTYEIVVKNPYIKDGVPTQEMENISLKCQLNTSKVLIKENYTSQEQASADKIKNKVEINTSAYKGNDTYQATKEAETIPKLNNDFTITKTADKEEVKPGDAIKYTIAINNTGNLPLSEDKEVTDTLPDYLVLTEEQKTSLKNNGATVSTKNGKTTIKWKPGKIAVGDTKSLEFSVNVASAEEMKKVSDNTPIKNKATYSDSEAESTITYKKPKLEIKKSNNKNNQTLKNGDIITYTITIENQENIETAAQTIEDILQKGLIFQNMVDKNGNTIALNEGKFYAESSSEKNKHEVTLTENGQNLTWNLGTLAPNEKVTIYYTCKVDTDQLDSGVTTIKNTAKSTTTGEKSEENKNDVENAISIDKKVDGTKEDTYKNGDSIDYSITIKNADGDAASTATDLILKDELPAGLVPVYELYSLNDTSKDFKKGEVTAEYLTEIEETFEAYVKNLNDWTERYTIIDDEAVRVTKQHGSADLRSVTLEWYVGSMASGKSIEKKYQVKLCMSDSQIETGKEVTYKNTATIKNISDSEEIKGKDNSGTIILEKQVKGSLKYDNLTDAQKEAIKFEITCKNPAYSKEVKLSEFTRKDSEKATYTLSKLPYGTYTITETGYDGTEFEGYQDTITIEGGDNGKFTGSSKNVTISESSKATAEIKIKNEYATTDSPSVDIQKSVWAIEDVYFNYGSQQSNIISSKSIFDKSSHTGDEDGIYVIYNISVMNTGDKDVHISKIVDELPDGLTYVGMKADLYTYNVSSFTQEINTDQWAVDTATSLAGNDVLNNIKITKEDSESSSVTFKVGNKDKGIYLAKGKALSFFIMCKVDSNVDIDKSLTNTAKLIVDKTVEYKEYGCVTMKGTGHDDKQNNGDANEVIDKENTREISSSVTIKPTKSIVPGITKTAIGYIGTGQAESTMTEFKDENKKNSISPQSTIKWEIELINDGTVPITEYSITDTVDTPFHILTQSEAEGTLKITSPFRLQIGDNDPVDLSNKVWSTVTDDEKQRFTVSIGPDNNLTIPVGGKAILTVYTKNDTFSTGIYKNEAIFTPVVQEDVKFDGDSVVDGELVKDSSGKYTGVKASDSVYALGDYGSFSWKSITEKNDETNYGVGYESHNYITIDGETSKDVIYTNNIENVSKNPFRNLVIMDLMPYEGDTGVLNQNERGSQFSVTFSNNLKIYDKSSESDLNPTEVRGYNVYFSSETSFTDDEMQGKLDISVWHDTWQNGDKSFCVVLPEDYSLNTSHILTLQYEGIIGEDASPGEIAWNSFGYCYKAQIDSIGKVLRAEPPKVGVMIKKQSTIRKEVVDSEGTSQPYDVNKMFTFTIYKGEDASGDSLGSFQICQGGFVNLHELKNVDGNPITLQSGQTYTVIETDTNGCNFVGVGKEGEEPSNENTYTFTYSTGEAITIVFKNKMSSYILPSTGGVGVARYFAGGALLMSITALLYGCLWRRRRERRFR